MKRADLMVGSIVEDKGGSTYIVVDDGGWQKFAGYRVDATGVTYAGIPVRSAARSVPVHGNVGVLVVGQHWLHGIQEGDPTMGTILVGEAKLPQHLYPSGTYWGAIKARQAAMEARVEEDVKRDAELVEQVNLYWGDVPHLIATCGVHLDDNGLLTERERQVIITMILCGQNR